MIPLLFAWIIDILSINGTVFVRTQPCVAMPYDLDYSG